MANKTIRRLSSLTSLRGMQPTSGGIAKFFMNFRFDHTKQMNVRPNRLGCAYEGFTTPNAGGKPAVAGIGGSHDTGTIVHTHPGHLEV